LIRVVDRLNAAEMFSGVSFVLCAFMFGHIKQEQMSTKTHLKDIMELDVIIELLG
jgi:hypothetical protein